MVQWNRSETCIAPAPVAKNRIVGKNRLGAFLERALRVGIYYPLLLLARFFVRAVRANGEARRISVTQQDIALPQLPREFDGLRVAFLSDFHCSAETPPEFLAQVVAETNRLEPDLILLGGDYVTEDTHYIAPLTRVLARLAAPLGVFGVLGNHDFLAGAAAVRAALAHANIVDVTNQGRWLRRGESRIRIAGVGDLWEGTQDLDAALGDAESNHVVILLSHNPDYAPELCDPRVRLVLAGHTHGGQINLPRVGPVITNSRYGRRLTSGLVAFDSFQLYVSRGLGTVFIPFRYCCAPEVVLFTLRASGSVRQDV